MVAIHPCPNCGIEYMKKQIALEKERHSYTASERDDWQEWSDKFEGERDAARVLLREAGHLLQDFANRSPASAGLIHERADLAAKIREFLK